MIKDLRIIKVKERFELHHTTCNKPDTLILAWNEEYHTRNDVVPEEMVHAINEHTCNPEIAEYNK